MTNRPKQERLSQREAKELPSVSQLNHWFASRPHPIDERQRYMIYRYHGFRLVLCEGDRALVQVTGPGAPGKAVGTGVIDNYLLYNRQGAVIQRGKIGRTLRSDLDLNEDQLQVQKGTNYVLRQIRFGFMRIG